MGTAVASSAANSSTALRLQVFEKPSLLLPQCDRACEGANVPHPDSEHGMRCAVETAGLQGSRSGLTQAANVQPLGSPTGVCWPPLQFTAKGEPAERRVTLVDEQAAST